MSCAEYLGSYLSDVYLVQRDVRSNTAEQLQVSVKLFERWNGGAVQLSELSELLVSQWLASYQVSPLAGRGKLPSPATVQNKRRAVLTVWRHASKCGLAKCPDPDRIRRVRVQRPAPIAWTLCELSEILTACDRLPGQCLPGIDRRLWWRAFVLVAYDTALRLGDILGLRFDQIAAEFSITQNKTGCPHVVFLRRATIDAVSQIDSPRRELVFEWRLPRRAFYTRFKRIVESAGVRPGTSKFIRRSSASYIERDNPGMAMRHLGHRTAGLAERNYIDPTIAGAVRPQPPEIR